MPDTKNNLINMFYKFGGIDTSKPLPVGVTLSLDSSMKKTLIVAGACAGVGIGLGIGIVMALSKRKK